MQPVVGPEGLGPLDFGGILDRSVALLRRGFLPMVSAVAVVIVPLQLVAEVLGEVGPDDFGVTETRNRFGEIQYQLDGGDFAVGLVVALIGVFLTFVGSQLATAACTKLVAGAVVGAPTSWRESLRFARRQLWPMLGLSLVAGVLLVPAFLALVVPGIYFVVAWSVATPVLLLEGQAAWPSLKRSRELVRGTWGHAALVLLVGIIASAVAVGGLTLAMTAPVDLLGASDGVRTVAQVVATIVGTTLVTPLAATLTLVLYVDLRVRKERFDLTLLALGIDSEPGARPPEHPDIPPPPPYLPPR